MLRRIACVLIFVMLFPVYALAADDIPALPHCFYGSLTVFNADGTQSVGAPAGTEVSARIAGSNVTEDTLITTETGRYGGAGATDAKLLVGKRGGVPANAVVQFFANGVKTLEEGVFVSGAVTELSLTARDVEGPAFENLSPADGSSITNSKPTIGATPVDNLAGPDLSTVSLSVDGKAVTPQINAGRVEYTPSDALALGNHTVQIAVDDVFGNKGSRTWSFTIVSGGGGPGGGGGGGGADLTPPTVDKTDPPDGAKNVPVNKKIMINFSERIKEGTAFNGITLKSEAGASVSITGKKIEGQSLTLDHDNLANSTTYAVHLPAGAVQDLAGNALKDAYDFKFSTQEIRPAPVAFSDIGSHWASECITDLAGRGAIGGYPDGTFKPDKKITRLEAACILTKALQLSPGTDNDLAKFSDRETIPAWGREAAGAATRERLMNGYPHPDGTLTFEPFKLISRAEEAALLARVIESKLGTQTPAPLTFSDSGAIPEWAKGVVGVAFGKKIVGGYPDNTFRPRNDVTRGEVACMIVRLLKSIEQS
ncbi:MAG: S-layer homology domain-containing protein [Bacillota bacterium]